MKKLPCYAIISASADHELYALFLHRQEPTALFYEDMAAIRMLSNTKRFIVPVNLVSAMISPLLRPIRVLEITF